MIHSRRKQHPSVDRRAKDRRKQPDFYHGNERRTPQQRRAAETRRLMRDRRRHIRFPIVTETVRPIEFTMHPSPIKEPVPGIITQLSPGGMAMVAFTPVTVGTSLFLTINLPHIKVGMVEGKVVRVEQKGESFLIGIHFNHIRPDERAALNRMSLDYADCELKLSFGITDVCEKSCNFYALCEKPQKIS